MSAQVIDGKLLSDKVKERVKLKVEKLKALGIVPCLAVILVGEDAASQIYVRNKEKGCEATGIRSLSYKLPVETTQAELDALIQQLNDDASVHGILVQLPLPAHLDEERTLDLIRPEKDVDGFHAYNTGKLFNGRPGVVACTPKGVLEMILSTGVDLFGKEAVMVGRSNIVGKPMALLMNWKNMTVTLCHRYTQDLASFTRRADVLVVAVGHAGLITADMVKPGAVVIDVGINRVNGKVVGDVDFDAVKEVAGYISPVPGGVGRMTIAMLLDNAVEVCMQQTKVSVDA